MHLLALACANFSVIRFPAPRACFLHS